MQPISNVFQKLERNILDLSKTLNKEVKVELCGSDVELDKTVIERIADPLMHIVRNAIDHGIEDAVARKSTAKPAIGTIQITATKDTFGVEIHIRDDGRGLAVERILAKAKEKGLVKADATLTKEQIFQLIFLPSFSTAEKVTDVSGRGVGMDVVMQSLRDLQGSIRIDSDVGVGTSFYITLPTSVSIIDGMLIVLDGQKYVVPVTAIEEVIDLKSYLGAGHHGMFNLRDQVIPVESMAKVISQRGLSKAHKSDALLICKHGDQRLAFTVDAVLDQQQVVIRPLNENIDGVFGLLGGTILGDGEPSLILDVPAMAEKYISSIRPKETAA
jgi:two-component system chemotaxis sensor kinase CheA